MENWLGLLRIHVQRGVNLAIRDAVSSDPYVVFRMGKQKLKTRVVKRNVDPEWNDLLTLSVTDPNTPVKLFVYDEDTFSFDDKMGDAEFEIGPFLKAVKMGFQLQGLPDGVIISKVEANRQNCLAEESKIFLSNGKLFRTWSSGSGMLNVVKLNFSCNGLMFQAPRDCRIT